MRNSWAGPRSRSGSTWNHPIFTPAGFAFFWTDVLKSFWRGELIWHGALLASGPIDAIYVGSSTVLVAAYVIAEAARARKGRGENRLAAAVCVLMFALSLGMLVLGSIAWDFGNCPHPSSESPYLVAGRLMLGALVPFLIMYLSGLDVLLGWLRLRFARVPAIVLLAGIATASEIVLSLPVFASQFNWYHLP